MPDLFCNAPCAANEPVPIPGVIPPMPDLPGSSCIMPYVVSAFEGFDEDEVLASFSIPTSTTFAANMAGFQYNISPDTLDTTISIQVDGVEVGTATIVDGVMTIVSPELNLSTGDVLSFVGGSTVVFDVVSFTLIGTKAA